MNTKTLFAVVLGTLILAGCQIAPSKDINEREMYARLIVMTQDLSKDCAMAPREEIKKAIDDAHREARVMALYSTTKEVAATSKILANDFAEMKAKDYSNPNYCGPKTRLIERKATRMLDAMKEL